MFIDNINNCSSFRKCKRIGTRSSRLARWQAERVTARLSDAFPAVRLTVVALSSPGDRDRETDLRESPPDFFTRDLDAAVLAGELDAALHCAKDLPLPPPPGLDWWWLPWHEDIRDVLVFRRGEEGRPPRRIGVSSERRAAYCRQRFPEAELAPVRGDIDDRLRQLDEGRFDVLILAAAGLLRLGLSDRIGEWLSPDDLPVPEGQGILALTFREGDRCWQRLRGCFLPPVVFAGAGPGAAELLTCGAEKALRRAEVCLADALVSPSMYENILSPKVLWIDVGKRGGGRRTEQSVICDLLAEHVRKGRRVVRLKGGDPGLFGRLAEETGHLDGLGIPYRVLPGVSSLLAATTGTGLLLTRRNRSRAFLAYAPRQAGSASPYLPLAAEERARPATAVFMGSAGLRELVADHLACGWDRGTPGAIVLAAGTENQHVCQAPLSELADVSLPSGPDGKPLPGLILLGEVAVGPPWPRHGPLGGRRVLFTGSRMLADRTVNAIRDRDGIPLPLPLLELEPDPGILPTLARLPEFDWLVLGSPAAAEILLAMLSQSHVDLRRLPRILTAGPATAAILAAAGIFAELVADPPYGVAGLQERIAGDIRPGQRILRLRSELADTALSDLLAATGAKVDDAVLYRNRPPTSLLPLPDFDAILFASDSAVKRFHEAYGAEPLHGKMAGVVGEPTRRALAAVEARIERVVMPRESTVEAMVDALAQACVNRWIDEQSKEEE